MRIMVVLRMVPDPAGDMEVAGDGASIDRDYVDLRLNDFDDHALEQAVLMKEASAAEVLAVAPTGAGIDKMLQTALARGADRVLRIGHEMGEAVTSRALAPLVAALARQEGVDLVLTGVQTTEDLFGQLAPYAGALLDWPHVSAVGGAVAKGEAVEVLQELGNGVTARLSVPLPAVLGIQAATQAPRYVSGAKLRQSAGIRIGEVRADAVALANPATVETLRAPERSGRARMLGADADAVADGLVTVLREHGILKGAVR